MQFCPMSRGRGGAGQARPGQCRDVKLEICCLERTEIYQSELPSVRDGLGNRPGLSPNICKNNDKAIEETENLNL